VVSPDLPAAASVLLADVLGRPAPDLVEVARTRVSVHYETGVASAPVLCVCTTDAVLLPNAVITPRLPGPGRPALVVRRWWRPRRPTGLRPPRTVDVPRNADPVDVPDAELDPHRLVGRGPGLTPAGDDLLAAALVTAHATGDPRWPAWRAATRAALRDRTTTAVSRGLLHHAMDGYATPPLADLVEALCSGADPAGPTRRLLAVGHSSGAALLAGVRHTLTTRELEGAA
jgi:hypothetical protein